MHDPAMTLYFYSNNSNDNIVINLNQGLILKYYLYSLGRYWKQQDDCCVYQIYGLGSPLLLLHSPATAVKGDVTPACPCICSCALRLVIEFAELFELKGAFRGHLVQLPCSEQWAQSSLWELLLPGSGEAHLGTGWFAQPGNSFSLLCDFSFPMRNYWISSLGVSFPSRRCCCPWKGGHRAQNHGGKYISRDLQRGRACCHTRFRAALFPSPVDPMGPTCLISQDLQ